MKRERHGRAKILTPEEIQLLFNQGLQTLRDRALFGFCLYTACRINEACTQLTTDAYEHTGAVRPYMTIRKGNSKGKLASRTIPTSEDLRLLLGQYRPHSGDKYLFPGRWNRGHIHPDSASLILRTACRKVGLEGVSTHSLGENQRSCHQGQSSLKPLPRKHFKIEIRQQFELVTSDQDSSGKFHKD